MKSGVVFTVASLIMLTAGGLLTAGQAVPDVAGNISVCDAAGNIRTLNIAPSGSSTTAERAGGELFNLMPGWPIQVNGFGQEGGICFDVDGDGELEYICYIYQTVHVFNPDGTYADGWPQNTTYYAAGGPALGDIDGDGAPEIVCASIYTMTTGGIEAFELNGDMVAGFPVLFGYTSRSPVLSDLDGDGALEIITSKRDWPEGECWVLRGDGSTFPGWPQPLTHVPSSSAAVGDITGDGVPEVIFESYDGLHAWDSGGNPLPGFPYMMPGEAVNSYSSPVLADLDGDGLREIIFGTHISGAGGRLFVLHSDGSPMDGWPKATTHWIYGPPSVGYIDGDDVLDIVVGDQVLSPTPANRIYGWNAMGEVLAGFPIGPREAVNNQIALADLDGDGWLELIVDDNTLYTGDIGYYHGYNHDGTPLDGFPLQTSGSSFYNMTCLDDLDQDGRLDLVGGGTFSSASLCDIHLWTSEQPYSPGRVVIPCFQYNTRRDGVYRSPHNLLLVAGPGPSHDNAPLVRIFPPLQDSPPTVEFTAYGSPHWGVNVSIGDVNGTGLDVVLTGAGPGEIYGPHVRGFTAGGAPLAGLSFLAYGTNKYGVNVSAGDLDNDGYDEIITGAGPGAVFGPHVRAFDYDGGPATPEPVPGVSYFAYGTLKWGVNVAAGDIDGDGFDEIVTGAGPGSVFGAHVRGWNVDGGPASSIAGVNYFAYATPKWGVEVSCGDVDGDGLDEIVTGPGPGSVFGAHVRGFNYDGTVLMPISGISFFAWPPEELRYGAEVFCGTDLDGDGRAEILVGPGPDPTVDTPLKVYRFDGVETSEWFSLQAFDTGWMMGTKIASGRF